MKDKMNKTFQELSMLMSGSSDNGLGTWASGARPCSIDDVRAIMYFFGFASVKDMLSKEPTTTERRIPPELIAEQWEQEKAAWVPPVYPPKAEEPDTTLLDAALTKVDELTAESNQLVLLAGVLRNKVDELTAEKASLVAVGIQLRLKNKALTDERDEARVAQNKARTGWNVWEERCGMWMAVAEVRKELLMDIGQFFTKTIPSIKEEEKEP